MRRGAVRDRDLGYAALESTLRAFAAQKVEVRVGILGTAASARHGEGPRAPRKRSKKGAPAAAASKPTIVEIALVHELGSGRVPARSFLRSTFDAGRAEYHKYALEGLRREVLSAVRQRASLVPTQSTTLKRLALKIEGDVKKRIASNIAPPLSPVTIAKKGSSVALIDTGQLRNSVTSEVRRGGGV